MTHRPNLDNYDAWKTSGPDEPQLHEGPVNVTMEFGEDDEAPYTLEGYTELMEQSNFELVSATDTHATFTSLIEGNAVAMAEDAEAYLHDNHFVKGVKELGIDLEIETPGWPDLGHAL